MASLAEQMYQASQTGNAAGEALAERFRAAKQQDLYKYGATANRAAGHRQVLVAEAKAAGARAGLNKIRGMAQREATAATTVDRSHADALAGDVLARRGALMGRAMNADAGFLAGYGRSAGMGDQQAALGEALAARAIGGGPSVSGMQAAAQRDAVARQMAAAGGGLMAQRGAMEGSVDAYGSLAAQAAQARSQEVANAQGLAAQNMGSGMGQNLASQRMMFGRDVARQQLTDADMFAGYDMQQQAAMANANAEEAMRQRLYKLRLYEMGSKQAAEAQALQQRGAQIQAASTAATSAFGAGAGALGDWIKSSNEQDRKAAERREYWGVK